MKAKDAGAKYLEQILAKIPEEQRGAVQAALTQEAVLVDMGESLLRQEEFSRNFDELKKTDAALKGYRGQLEGWYAEKLGVISEAEKLKIERDQLKQQLEGG